MPYYEEFQVGRKHSSPSRTITDGLAEVLLDLGGYIAPQFTDEYAAKKTPLGWRALPGRGTYFLAGGLTERISELHTPGAGMLVGIEKVRLLTPVRVGDTVHVELEGLEGRETRKPQWGLVKHKERMVNQRGETVYEAEFIDLWERRLKQ